MKRRNPVKGLSVQKPDPTLKDLFATLISPKEFGFDGLESPKGVNFMCDPGIQLTGKRPVHEGFDGEYPISNQLVNDLLTRHSLRKGAMAVIGPSGPVQTKPRSTPASRWAETDGVDPFPKLLEQERADLPMGDSTDDELAFDLFVHGNMPLEQNMRAMINGEPSSIVYLKSGQERIRWLSRHLQQSLSNEQTLVARVKELEALLAEARNETE